MSIQIDLALSILAILVLFVCYVLILAKLKPSDESSQNRVFPLIRQGQNEQRRKEMLEKIKEEKIREYYSRRTKDKEKQLS
ncbi:MAG: hypothetical protein PVF15_05200 [Candidatus Bathyarchaeota archaeon]|jgi:hypothetical protein